MCDTAQTMFILHTKVLKLLLTNLRSHCTMFFFLSGIYNLYEFEPPHSGGSKITHKDTPQSVGRLWTSDQPVAETST